MFNRVSKLSKQAFVADASQTRGDLDVGSFESSLADAEAVQYVLASAAGIEQTTADRTTTIEPGPDTAAYAVVSNRRVYFLLGDDLAEPELTVDMEQISNVELRNALLSTTLVFSTTTGTVRFVPADTETAEVVVSYVSRVGTAWADLFEALEKAHRSLASVESAIKAGEDPESAIQQTRTRLSNAHHCATHHDDAPTELMRDQIQPVEDRLEQLRYGSRLDRADGLIDDARRAQRSGAFEDGVAAVVEATDVIRDVASVLHDVDAPGLSDRLTSQANTLDTIAQALLNEAERACHRALQAADDAAAIAAWQEALDRYREAAAAGWDGPAGASQEALRFQLTWVVGNLVDALVSRADEREAAAEEFGGTGSDAIGRYEEACRNLERARDLAEDHPELAAAPLEDRIGTLEVKIERAEWQWGSAD
ncbi:hypothetical protein OB920_08970 [Halobacteria archaeon HArc-gm2]|nr:hypothetical protein [Halobacteria archaeon HArc-gm2]